MGPAQSSPDSRLLGKLSESVCFSSQRLRLGSLSISGSPPDSSAGKWSPSLLGPVQAWQAWPFALGSEVCLPWVTGRCFSFEPLGVKLCECHGCLERRSARLCGTPWGAGCHWLVGYTHTVWSGANGLLRMSSQMDICDPSSLAVFC